MSSTKRASGGGVLENHVFLDRQGNPAIRLAQEVAAPDHTVVLEELRPVVRGYCSTCQEDWPTVRVADRKARSCGVMVRYLSYVNRDRSHAEAIRRDVERALGVG